ncbi:MAG TPA: hypothetical protein ENK10_05980, partial [Acidobacteria bacterium]|nr:hypothetical protein [Acidobacteriota bacterium]
NGGTLAATRDLSLTAGSLLNLGGTLAAGGSLTAVASGDLLNLSGTIRGTGVDLLSVGGSLLNVTDGRERTLRHDLGTEHYTLAGRAAVIEAGSGGLRAAAADRIVSVGADWKSDTGIDLAAGRGVEVRTLARSRGYDYDLPEGYARGESLRRRRSTLEAAEGIRVRSGGDLSLEAARLAADSVDLAAAGAVNLSAVLEQDFHTEHFTGKGFLSKWSVTDSALRESVKGTEIAAGDLSIAAGKDLTIQAADLSAERSMHLRSEGGDIRLTSLGYTVASSHEEEHSALGGLLRSSLSEQRSADRLRGAAATAGSSLRVGGRRLSLESSTLGAKTIDLQVESVRLEEGKERTTHALHTDDSGLLIRTIHDEGSVTETAVGSAISARESLRLRGAALNGNRLTAADDLLPAGVSTERALLKNRRWNETHRMLSPTGALIVQAVANFIIPGVGNALSAGIGNAVLQRAVAASVNAVTRRIVAATLEAALTGNGLHLDAGSLARTALGAGLSAGVDLQIHDSLASAPLLETGAHALAHAGVQSALSGARFQDVLLGELTQDLSDRAFFEVGSASMMASLGEGIPGFSEGGLFKVLFHGLTGGVAAELMGGRFAAGAAAATTRELLAPLSQGADKPTQRFVSSLIGITAGAVAGGDRGAEIGYAVALSAEANNRQLHQREIRLIRENAAEFAREKGLSTEEARSVLARTAL